jgi:Domain of unknown function DUF29
MEEVEDLERSVRHAIESQLERLLLHLLVWRDDPAQDLRRLWRLSILDARHEISKALAEKRSLHGYPAELLADAYRYARGVAALEMELPLAIFPTTCLWTVDQVLDEEFLPKATP